MSENKYKLIYIPVYEFEELINAEFVKGWKFVSFTRVSGLRYAEYACVFEKVGE